jgi:hypothetical protein
MHRKALVLSFLSFLLLVSGCLGLGNNQLATFQKIGDRYLIEVTGRRASWSHDLSSLKSYDSSWTFDVPRIDGKIDGKEIRPKPGFLPYVGAITIQSGKMVVDLKVDNYVYHKFEREDWNGSYTLVEKKPEAPSTETEKKP